MSTLGGRSPSVRLAAAGVLLLIACAAYAACSAPARGVADPSGAAPAAGAEVLWDTWGIPHIMATDDRALGYAFGWAQMENHGDLLLRVYGQARGRAAEYWGDANLAEDRWVRTLGGPALGRAAYAAQDPAFRRYVDAFVDGVNAYARAHPERLADSVKVVLPVEGSDVFAHVHRVLTSFFIVSRDQLRAETARWDRDAGSGGAGATGGAAAGGAEPENGARRGSNAWAIGPGRSASGHAMLLANPHLPWGDVFTWFEAQAVAPGLDEYGAALVGSPVLQIAFNDALGWTHTVNTQDAADLYELSLAGDGYRWNGGVRPFQVETQLLRVRRGGTLEVDTLRIRRSVHGPVVRERAGKALALRLAGVDPRAAPRQWWDMGHARSLAEFERAIARMGITGQNIMYADRAGHILYHYGGNTPVRPRGDRADWAGIVPGDSSATLWTSLLGYEQMPRVLDPPSGWLQNANDPPWWVTFPPVYRPSDFPAYLAPLPMAFRPQRSVRMLAGDSSVTYEDLLSYKHSTRLELADRVLDDLLRAAAHSSRDTRVARAADVLARWDRSADADSRGAVLFAAWWDQMTAGASGGRGLFATPWSVSAPRTTPTGLADPAAAVRALAAAAEHVERTYGALDVPWGSVYRFRRDTVDLPGNGASGALGAFRVVNYASATGQRFVAVGGDSYVAAIEFATPVRASALVGYGNASQPGSPHRVDQLPLLGRQSLRPVWRDRAAIGAHLERREQVHR